MDESVIQSVIESSGVSRAHVLDALRTLDPGLAPEEQFAHLFNACISTSPGRRQRNQVRVPPRRTRSSTRQFPSSDEASDISSVAPPTDDDTDVSGPESDGELTETMLIAGSDGEPDVPDDPAADMTFGWMFRPNAPRPAPRMRTPVNLLYPGSQTAAGTEAARRGVPLLIAVVDDSPESFALNEVWQREDVAQFIMEHCVMLYLTVDTPRFDSFRASYPALLPSDVTCPVLALLHPLTHMVGWSHVGCGPGLGDGLVGMLEEHVAFVRRQTAR